MDGWMNGWMDVKAVLGIAYSNQKLFSLKVLVYNQKLQLVHYICLQMF
jgi:hypothetical protein